MAMLGKRSPCIFTLNPQWSQRAMNPSGPGLPTSAGACCSGQSPAVSIRRGRGCRLVSHSGQDKKIPTSVCLPVKMDSALGATKSVTPRSRFLTPAGRPLLANVAAGEPMPATSLLGPPGVHVPSVPTIRAHAARSSPVRGSQPFSAL